MLAFELFSWWYGQGWKRIIRNGSLRLVKVSHLFSVPILLRTLLAPWRRIITYPGASLDARLRAAGDNLVSRMVGFTVRTMVLLSAGVMLFVTALVSAIFIIAWPLLPLAVIVFMVLAVLA